MPHPVIHAEVRSEDPDATREFFAQLFDWKVASEGGFPGYTFMDTGVPGWHRGGDQSSPGRAGRGPVLCSGRRRCCHPEPR